jgi:hypothetical protein
VLERRDGEITMNIRKLLLATVCFGLSMPVLAQDDAASSVWSWYGDLKLRVDHVQDLAGRDDLERNRSRLRFGARRMFDNLEFGVALEGALGSDDNRDNRRNNDNERSDALNLDELYLRWNVAGWQTFVETRVCLAQHRDRHFDRQHWHHLYDDDSAACRPARARTSIRQPLDLRL